MSPPGELDPVELLDLLLRHLRPWQQVQEEILLGAKCLLQCDIERRSTTR